MKLLFAELRTKQSEAPNLISFVNAMAVSSLGRDCTDPVSVFRDRLIKCFMAFSQGNALKFVDLHQGYRKRLFHIFSRYGEIYYFFSMLCFDGIPETPKASYRILESFTVYWHRSYHTLSADYINVICIPTFGIV